MVNPPISDQVTLLYAELKHLASAQIRRERADHTLSATGLVHEAYIRLAQSHPEWNSRAHFFGLAANTMRQVLIDFARSKQAVKRGSDWQRLTLTSALPEVEASQPLDSDAVEVLALDAALTELARQHARQARIVELRYFGGLSLEDTAAALDISLATVKRDWLVARLFLKRILDQ